LPSAVYIPVHIFDGDRRVGHMPGLAVCECGETAIEHWETEPR
jgi:hypothetical protein